jgi:hypothetical protein
MASTTRTTTLKIAQGHGLSLTRLPQRAKALCSCSSSVLAAVCFACSRAVMPAFLACSLSRRLRTVSLTPPMKAGTSVSATSMVIATTIAAARPSAPTKLTPEM